MGRITAARHTGARQNAREHCRTHKGTAEHMSTAEYTEHTRARQSTQGRDRRRRSAAQNTHTDDTR
eukprot:3057330-Pyramimonas_sp.AAC.1